MRTSITNDNNIVEDRDKENYSQFLQTLKENFEKRTSEKVPLFLTATDDLYSIFTAYIPEKLRPAYNCSTCRNFVNKYGGLVTIKKDGQIESVMWNDMSVPEFFKDSVKEVKEIVLKSQIKGVFLSETNMLGQPVTGDWEHMAVELPYEMTYIPRIKSSREAMCEKLEDYKLLSSSLLEYSFDVIEQAVLLLKTESLYRFEKCVGAAEWFQDVYSRYNKTKNHLYKENIIWLAAATCPAGYCHIKTSMIGTLLDDIAAGLPFDSISRRFEQKMDPSIYQRPQAAPSAGNIAQAEKIVEKLGIQNSLARRFATIDEVEKVWVTNNYKKKVKQRGVFSDLIPKNKKKDGKIDIPPITMTWRKFLETVLPTADEIEFLVEEKRENYGAILTAVYMDAPPILQWDTYEKRNPFSQYIYRGGSLYNKWGLSLGYCKVTGICYTPHMWYKEYKNYNKAVFFLLEGAKDYDYKTAGNALFPENLKSELREIRATVEAYSKKEIIEDFYKASACGIKLEYGNDWNAVFKVKDSKGIVVYRLDRWD